MQVLGQQYTLCCREDHSRFCNDGGCSVTSSFKILQAVTLHDKMLLKEAMKELWMKGIQGKNWRLIYKLNTNNILTPITDLGECEVIKVNEMIKQGSVLAAVISAITIDSLTRMLDKCKCIWEIEGNKINPLLFQDDIIIVNRTKDMKKTVNVIETLQNLKRLEFHEGKTKKSIFSGKLDEKIKIN